MSQSVEEQLAEIAAQIKALKTKRDKLIKDTPMQNEQLKRILAMRAPQQTLCQMLRDLYAVLDEPERGKIGECLLVAKKMDAKLAQYAGIGYAASWYGADGRFKG